LILHYLGDEETEKEVQVLKAEIQGIGAQAVIIPGDIGDIETTNKVSHRNFALELTLIAQ
jgi:L-rhamnose 1-dehydrogenase